MSASIPTKFDTSAFNLAHATVPPLGWFEERLSIEFPARFADLKAHLIPQDKVAEVVQAWGEICAELRTTTERFRMTAQENIPMVDFSEIHTLSQDRRDSIRRSGCVVIKNVVDDEKALEWKKLLQEYLDTNPQIGGFPTFNPQFYECYWTRSQLEARAHPNVLAVNVWLNEFFHFPEDVEDDALAVDLSVPLVYADRFRIRKPSREPWTVHSPHIDGGATEKWEDQGFRDVVYKDILNGDWKKHDHFDIRGRLLAKPDLYDRPNQPSVFRSWQGWLSMSNTGPGGGTLRLFPDVLLSNAYVLLRPFFSPISSLAELQLQYSSDDQAIDAYLDASNWKFDTSSPGFPGIYPIDGGKQFARQKLNANTHPHMRLDKENTMISVPRVQPGDMVFWHCDEVHSVEELHSGPGDSAVMYIPAVPLTEINLAYVAKQKDTFLAGTPGPDFPPNPAHISEAYTVKRGTLEDVGSDPVALHAMGLGEEDFVVDGGLKPEARRMRELANQVLYPRLNVV